MEHRVPLVRIVKDWDSPDFFRQIPGGGDTWEGVRFTEEAVEVCDYLLVLNRVTRPVRVIVPPENVWLLIQEPNRPEKDFVTEGHERFARVLTHHRVDDSTRYIASQPAIPWMVGCSYDDLVSIAPMPKSELLSVIASNFSKNPGHRLRWEFVQRLQKEEGIRDHIFGRGVRHIEDKWDGLAPYRYSVAIENSSSRDYWTEKLADCFLSWTVPLYFGCTNLNDYFPERSYIWLPIERPDEALEVIRSLRDDDWESRIDAVREARELVLNRYQFFPHLSSLIRESEERRRPSTPQQVRLPVRERGLGYRLRRRLRKIAGLPGPQ